MLLCMVFWVILKYICTVLVENSQTSPLKLSLSWPQVQKYYSEANAANDHNLQRNKPETAGTTCQKSSVWVCARFYSSCHLASFIACSMLGHYGKLEIHVSPCGLRSAVTPRPNQNSWILSVKVIERLRNNQLAAHKIPTYTCSPEQTDMLIQLNEHMRLTSHSGIELHGYCGALMVLFHCTVRLALVFFDCMVRLTFLPLFHCTVRLA